MNGTVGQLRRAAGGEGRGCVQGPWGLLRGAAWASGDPGQRGPQVEVMHLM